jgi:hypothetical protein
MNPNDYLVSARGVRRHGGVRKLSSLTLESAHCIWRKSWLRLPLA